jgi:hypothetical protein
MIVAGALPRTAGILQIPILPLTGQVILEKIVIEHAAQA